MRGVHYARRTVWQSRHLSGLALQKLCSNRVLGPVVSYTTCHYMVRPQPALVSGTKRLLAPPTWMVLPRPGASASSMRPPRLTANCTPSFW
jgi:hypothetical protein